MGRPRKPRVDKQSVRVVLNFTLAEKKRLDEMARKAGLPVATLARLKVLAPPG